MAVITSCLDVARFSPNEDSASMEVDKIGDNMNSDDKGSKTRDNVRTCWKCDDQNDIRDYERDITLRKILRRVRKRRAQTQSERKDKSKKQHSVRFTDGRGSMSSVRDGNAE